MKYVYILINTTTIDARVVKSTRLYCERARGICLLFMAFSDFLFYLFAIVIVIVYLPDDSFIARYSHILMPDKIATFVSVAAHVYHTAWSH